MTKALHTTSHIGPDGVLKLSLPVGMANTDVKVRIEVESVARISADPRSEQEEWHRFLDETAGTWQGTFDRPPQGDFEQRLPLE